MRRRLQLTTLLVASFALAACAAAPELQTELTIGSLSDFEQTVQPILTQRCGSGGCHGRADRPLSLYAPGAQRADPKQQYLDLPLSDAEMTDNSYRAAAFAQSCTAPACLLTCKPLAQRAGGCHHGGGEIFSDQRDADYQALVHWLPAAQAASVADAGAP